ncbi:MAG: ATP-dependent Clp protease ATP-binding subunit [Chloroflexi bacterium]|nr:ATP-dependent Clp protease ATP-binding subunit [Chloroflexota bacterium]
MSQKLDRFTKKTQQILSQAVEEARRLNHDYVGTEHLLLSLVKEEEGITAQVLRGMDVRPLHIIRSLERMMPERRGTRVGRPVLTPSTKQVIQTAIDEARTMGHHYINPGHLLLGLVALDPCIATEALEKLGVNPQQVRTAAVRHLLETGEPSPERARGEKTPRPETKLLDQLAVDLTALAAEDKLDPVVGRQKEVERVIQILSRRTKNNPALVGEPGVGKTAIVEGIAQRIVAGDVPESLQEKRLLMLDVGSLVAGTMYRGQFEQRLKRVIEEIKGSKSILFIDEVHMLVGAGSAGSSVDAANILKPALARGELQCIGATTLSEYRKRIEGDAALERRFQPVLVEEPTIEETIDILQGVKARYEAHHNLDISEEAVRAAAQLTARYVTDRFLPDKAIDAIDEAASRVRMYKTPRAVALREAFTSLRAVEKQRQDALLAEQIEEAIALSHRAGELQEQMEQMRLDWQATAERPRVTADDVAEVVSMWTGVPVSRIAAKESQRLLQMEEALHERVVGQDEPICAIAKAVRRARTGLKDPTRPIGSFVFLGPTGVGKTLLAKALAEFMFGSEDALLQLDMSEFMERHSVARLVGAPPGYIGYEEAGQLTEAIRRRPYSVICFDEIEKAHPDAFNMLLQIMEDGQLSDAKGRRVDFRNTIVIMTSNVAAELIKRSAALGFQAKAKETDDRRSCTPEEWERDYQEMRQKVLAEFNRTFRPEFRNRLDGVMVFRALTRAEIKRIVDLELKRVQQQLNEQEIILQATEAAKEKLAEEGYNPEFGARPLRRVIQHQVEDTLSEMLLAERFAPGDIILVDVNEQEEIELRVNEHSAGADEVREMLEEALG